MSGEEPPKKVAKVAENGIEKDLDIRPERNSRCLETQFGISCFLSSLKQSVVDLESEKPVNVILKHRFSDFVVNEVDESGQVVSLSSLELAPASLQQQPLIDDSEMFEGEILEVLQNTTSNKVRTWVKLMPVPEEKSSRKVVHKRIGHFFGNLISKTIDGHIHVMFSPNKRDERGQCHTQWEGQNEGSYCSFVLCKQGLSTMEAIDVICKKLSKPNKAFNFAGTKDKRAVTYQNVTAFKIAASKLQEINSLCSNIKVGNFSYVKTRLGLGASNGNVFKLFLRNISEEDADLLRSRLAIVRENGFANYFGLQRFGTINCNNPQVGLAILKDAWAEVVKLMLFGESNLCNELFKSAGLEELFSKGESLNVSEQIFSKIPNCIEKKFLVGLQKCGYESKQKIVEAFHFIPRSSRLMYLHSYQSLLFNLTVSERLNKFGLSVTVGDLAWDQTEQKPVHIDAKNIACYDITDCIIPVVGSESVLPKNLGGFIREWLHKDGLTQESFDHRIKEYRLKGDYRKVLCVPQNLEFEFVRYENPDDDVMKSDIDLMQKPEDNEPISDAAKRLLGMCLKFQLPSSSYATMLIREITHADTRQERFKNESLKFKLENEPEEVWLDQTNE